MTEDPDFAPFPAAAAQNAALGAGVDEPEAAPAPKPRGRPRKTAVLAGEPPATEATEAPLPVYTPALDPAAPPAYVKHRKTGLVTAWTNIFRDRANEFDVYYRPNSDDAAKHRALVQRVEMTRTLLGGGVLNAAQGLYGQTTIGG